MNLLRSRTPLASTLASRVISALTGQESYRGAAAVEPGQTATPGGEEQESHDAEKY